MNYNLFINYYVDKNELRQDELEFCFSQNLANRTNTKIVAFTTKEDYEHLASKYSEHLHRVHAIIQENRPTYNDIFQIMTKYFGTEDNINVITNSDIMVSTDAYTMANLYLTTVANCLALSRWDVIKRENYIDNSVMFGRADSQDTWIFKGGIRKIDGADFTMGIAGCDNSIAHLLHAAGCVLANPCSKLKTYHLHLTNIRNYIQGETIQRIPPPYYLVQPS